METRIPRYSGIFYNFLHPYHSKFKLTLSDYLSNNNLISNVNYPIISNMKERRLRITSSNRRSIFEVIKQFSQNITQIPDQGSHEKNYPILLKTQVGCVDANITIRVNARGYRPGFPFIAIDVIQKPDGLIAHKLIGFDTREVGGIPAVVTLTKTDTWKGHESIGIGSGLFVGSEQLIKKVVDITPAFEGKTVMARTHDDTNVSEHTKRKWTGVWARRMGYKEGEKDVFYKKLK